MSDTSSHRSNESTAHLISRGTSAFAGVMLTVVAALQIIEGFAAIAKDNVFVTGINYTYEFDVTTWGWVHLVVGIIALGIGLGILAGQTWGLVSGILIATLGILANFAFMPYYPFWTIAIIALNSLVIWALCTEIARV